MTFVLRVLRIGEATLTLAATLAAAAALAGGCGGAAAPQGMVAPKSAAPVEREAVERAPRDGSAPEKAERVADDAANSWRAEPTAGPLLEASARPPSEQSWTSAEEATLWGLEATGCDAKQTERWLRIRCPMGPAEGQQPQFRPYGNGAWRARWSAAATELSVPLAPGLHSVLIVTDMGTSMVIDLKWRPHTERPAVLGRVNEGFMKACGERFGEGETHPYGEVADCRRAGHRDCEPLSQCLWGSPQHRPRCPEGWEFQAHCVLPCTSASDCATGWSCGRGPAGTPVCLRPGLPK